MSENQIREPHGDFERCIVLEPAFDKRHKDPARNYGIHGCNLRFVLIGPLGAVQFLLFTNWQLPHVTEEALSEPISDAFQVRARYLPMPADLGYHSPVPRHEGQETVGPCDWLDGQNCYYDGSGLAANDVFESMLRGGLDAVWKELETFYEETFSEADDVR